VSFCLISIPHVFFVLYGLFFVDKVNLDLNLNLNVSAKREDDSKHYQHSLGVKNLNLKGGVSTDGKAAKTFTFDELAAATGNFRSDYFVGEGGYGKVYKGYIEKINQVR